MDGQLGLPGVPPPPRLTERFYFAVLPEPAAQRQLVAAGHELHAQLPGPFRATRGHRLHVSLHSFGDYMAVPERLIERARAAMRRVSLPPFDVCFDEAMVFSGHARGEGRFPLALCAGEGARQLRQLALEVAQALHAAGLPAIFSSFNPHVTLGYTPGRMPPRAHPGVRWRVREFTLVHVRPGMELRHRLAGRWALSEDAGFAR